MSFDLVQRVRDRRDLKSPGKAILLCLALRANDARQCWPSLQKIALDSGYDVSTVKRSLARLADDGLVHRKPRLDADHGDPTSTLYTLAVSADPGAESTNPAEGPAQSTPSGLAHMTPGGMASTAPRISSTESPDQNPQHQRRAGARGSRLAPDWKPSGALVGFAREGGVTDLDTVAAEFRDYWCAVPGQRGVKLDWEATFRNRVREVAARQQRSGRWSTPRAKQPGGSTVGWNPIHVSKPGQPMWDGTLPEGLS